MKRDIRHSWQINADPETVWEYLTTPELIEQWLMKNDFKPLLGHKFMFKTKGMKAFGFDGNIYCEVTELVPIRKLAYTWRGGPGNGKIVLDSVVTWTLVPNEAGTELSLVHSGFDGMKNYLGYFFMNKGWGSKIKNKLTELIEKSKAI